MVVEVIGSLFHADFNNDGLTDRLVYFDNPQESSNKYMVGVQYGDTSTNSYNKTIYFLFTSNNPTADHYSLVNEGSKFPSVIKEYGKHRTLINNDNGTLEFIGKTSVA